MHRFGNRYEIFWPVKPIVFQKTLKEMQNLNIFPNTKRDNYKFFLQKVFIKLL